MTDRHRRPGQAAGLSIETITQAALELLDTEGTTALTVRGVARRLGVEAMSLYHYVPNKESLIQGVWDEVLTQVDLTSMRAASGGQQAAIEYASALRITLLEHPATLPLMLGRAAHSPRALAVAEEVLSAIGQGSTDITAALDLLNTLTAFTIAHAYNEHQLAGEAAPTFDPLTYPTLASAMRSGAEFANKPGRSDDHRRFERAIHALVQHR